MTQIHTSAADSVEIKQAVYQFIRSIDRMNVDSVVACYTYEAKVFYPFTFTPKLLIGKKEIGIAQNQGFKLMAKLFKQQGIEQSTLGLKPNSLSIELLSENFALAIWHSPRGSSMGRRSALLKKVNNSWLIHYHHASNVVSTD
ncbi:YybH family protein [Reichenbachiella faecimaris]|nr:hypothetical protein [Reichenbachiella faecimaris]